MHTVQQQSQRRKCIGGRPEGSAREPEGGDDDEQLSKWDFIIFCCANSLQMFFSPRLSPFLLPPSLSPSLSISPSNPPLLSLALCPLPLALSLPPHCPSLSFSTLSLFLLPSANHSAKQCRTPCALRSTCSECTSGSSSECMWCSNMKQCVDSNAYVASFPFGQCMEWCTMNTCPRETSNPLRSIDIV